MQPNGFGWIHWKSVIFFVHAHMNSSLHTVWNFVKRAKGENYRCKKDCRVSSITITERVFLLSFCMQVSSVYSKHLE